MTTLAAADLTAAERDLQYELLFDEPTHTYTIAGKKIPSVTQVLGWGRDTSRIPRWTGLFGTLVHKACELDSLGDLDESTLVAQEIDGRLCDPWPRLRAWRKRTNGARPDAVELPVWGEIDGLAYAGMIDVVWVNERGGYATIEDIKTGQKRPKEHGPQVAAYAVAYEQRTGRAVRDACCTYLAADETFERVIYDAAGHDETFRVALHKFYEANKGD